MLFYPKTDYYYFESKEQTLEEVIGMMIEKETKAAEAVVASPLPVPQKIVGIIAAIRPAPEEKPIEGALMRPENSLMHQKIKRRLVEVVLRAGLSVHMDLLGPGDLRARKPRRGADLSSVRELPTGKDRLPSLRKGPEK